VGRRFRTVDSGTHGPWTEIVGVVPDLGLNVADDTLAGSVYVPLRADTNAVYLALRVSGDPLAYANPLRRALLAHDPDTVIGRVQLLEDEAHEDRDFFKWFSMALLGLGVITLVLALAGVYAMMSLIVTRRTREIGVRMALGATAGRIISAVAGRAAWQVGLGGAVGCGLALLSLELRSVLVSRMGDGGTWTLPVVMAVLVTSGLAATWLPLRRALNVQAADALRSE
jgi:predicted lysophospholipase L1 biosynthesis ABC-type transport system permease subunit